MTLMMLRCPGLQHGVERHHKGLNSQNVFQIIMFKIHEQTYTVVVKVSNTSLDDLSVSKVSL